MTSRRGFLGALAGAIAGSALDPERLLWKPGKFISIPARNALISPSSLSADLLRALQHNTIAVRLVMSHWEGDFSPEGGVGEVLNIRRPMRFKVSSC